MESKISIIIPVYNAEKTLYKCLESLILQKYKNIEIILINDKSTDKSKEICIEFAEKYNFIKYISNQNNLGVSATRNIGLQEATGEYVMFVDSDDWVDYNYCDCLLNELESHNAQLAISGFWYHNDIMGVEPQRNVFNEGCYIDIKSKNDVVELYSKWHFSALWNKIFLKSIIDKNEIRFDENISIGEDMRFGIDYVRCIDNDLIVVINKSLYHYIHINPNSLWYKHMNQLDISVESMKYLFDTLDEKAKSDKYTIETFNKGLLYSYTNYLDFIVKSKSLSKKQKKDEINKILKNQRYIDCVKKCRFDENESTFKDMCYSREYKSWIKLKNRFLLKQFIYEKFMAFKKFTQKINYRLKREKNNVIIKKAKKQLNNDNFTIISQNCTGGVFYHDMKIKFLSPTINLHFKSKDFIRFVNNIEYYLSQELVMRYGEFYPIGRLDDIEIYFNHYETCKEAVEKWNQRKERINLEKIFVLITDRDGFNEELFNEFINIKYPKLLFTGNKKYKNENSIYYSEFEDNNQIGDILSNKKFYKEYKLINCINKL